MPNEGGFEDEDRVKWSFTAENELSSVHFFWGAAPTKIYNYIIFNISYIDIYIYILYYIVIYTKKHFFCALAGASSVTLPSSQLGDFDGLCQAIWVDCDSHQKSQL